MAGAESINGASYLSGFNRLNQSAFTPSPISGEQTGVPQRGETGGISDRVTGMPSGAAGHSMQAVEVSVEAMISRTFEARAQYTGANGARAAAYYRTEETMSVSASLRLEQAQKLAEAHSSAAAGMENPFSPEATAQRIADFALSFFPAFSQDHADMPFEERVDAFRKMVEGAIDEGFSEALAILGPLPESVMDSINQTRDLVREKLDSFFANLKGDEAEKGKKAAEDGTWGDYVSNFFSAEAEKAAA